MTRLVRGDWSRFAGVGALMLFVTAACGGESTSDGDDQAAGAGGSSGSGAASGGTAGSSAGSKSSSGGTASGGRGGGAGTSASGGKGGSAGTSDPSGGTSDGSGGAADGGTSGTAGSTSGSAGTGGAPPDIPLNPECEEFMPCGGDPEGSWTVVDTCLVAGSDVTFLDVPGCEDSVEGVGALVEGTRTYANGEVSFEQTVTARVGLLVTDACAQGLLETPDVDASMLCPLLPTLAAAGMTPLSSITCAIGDDDECHCDAYYDAETTTTTTTYTVDGNTITQGNGETYEFCQEGDSLILHSVGMTTDMGVVVDELTVEFERD